MNFLERRFYSADARRIRERIDAIAAIPLDGARECAHGYIAASCAVCGDAERTS